MTSPIDGRLKLYLSIKRIDLLEQLNEAAVSNITNPHYKEPHKRSELLPFCYWLRSWIEKRKELIKEKTK